jgi:hypothetical protein
VLGDHTVAWRDRRHSAQESLAGSQSVARDDLADAQRDGLAGA